MEGWRDECMEEGMDAYGPTDGLEGWKDRGMNGRIKGWRDMVR